MYDLQKAGWAKRIPAYILDVILLFILAVGFAALISVIADYDGHFETYTNLYQGYMEKVQTETNVDLNKDIPVYGDDSYPEDSALYLELVEKVFADVGYDLRNGAPAAGADTTQYNQAVAKFNEIGNAKYTAAVEKFNALIGEDEEAQRSYNLVVNLTLVMVTLGFLLSYLILEFILPLVFKNGQTIGKKIFAIGVMHTNSVRVNGVAMFVRTILGKFVFETMVPFYMIFAIVFMGTGIVGIILVALLVVLEIVCICVSKTRSPIHDLIAKTVVVDMNTQMIFDSTDALMAHKQEVHAEDVERQNY